MELDPSRLDYRDAYKLLIGAVLPRPIAFVSTLSIEGVPNLSPFAFYNAVSSQPPIVIVSVGHRPDGRRKDSAENAIASGELVINVVTEDLIERASLASGAWEPDVDEFALAGVLLLALACAPGAAPAQPTAPPASVPTAAATAALAGPSAAGPSKPTLATAPPVELKVGVLGTAAYGAHYIARERGYFQEVGI